MLTALITVIFLAYMWNSPRVEHAFDHVLYRLYLLGENRRARQEG